MVYDLNIIRIFLEKQALLKFLKPEGHFLGQSQMNFYLKSRPV
jgi:hypothetical protein